MCKLDWRYSSIKVVKKIHQGFLVTSPYQEYVVYEPHPIKFLFKTTHVGVGKVRCGSLPRRCPLNLEVIFFIQGKVVHFQNFLQKYCQGPRGRFLLPYFSLFLFYYLQTFFCIIFVYRLGTSNVTMQLSEGNLPNARSLKMKSVVSWMWDGSFSATGLRKSYTYADNFSVWLLTEETTGLPGLFTLCILGSK